MLFEVRYLLEVLGYMKFCMDNHHRKIRHSLRQNKNLDQNCVKIKNYGSAEIFTRPASFLAVLLYIYTGSLKILHFGRHYLW